MAREELSAYQLLSNSLNLFFWKAFIILEHLKQFSLRQAFPLKLASSKQLKPVKDEKGQGTQTEFLRT